jgi:hypothetical protein
MAFPPFLLISLIALWVENPPRFSFDFIDPKEQKRHKVW